LGLCVTRASYWDTPAIWIEIGRGCRIRGDLAWNHRTSTHESEVIHMQSFRNLIENPLPVAVICILYMLIGSYSVLAMFLR